MTASGPTARSTARPRGTFGDRPVAYPSTRCGAPTCVSVRLDPIAPLDRGPPDRHRRPDPRRHDSSGDPSLHPLGPRQHSVVVVDDDRDIAELVQTILLDEGFKVSCLYTPSADDVKAAVDRLEPDLVLLDGGHPATYGPSWDIATWLAARPRPVPTVMLTGHRADLEEAMLATTDRARAAQVAATISKPFDIDHLIRTVHMAVGDTPPLSDRQDADDLARLLETLRVAGADELAGSTIDRVWATFRGGNDRALYKVYRWRAAEVYFIGRYGPDGQQLLPLAQFATLDALTAYCRRQIKGSRLS